MARAAPCVPRRDLRLRIRSGHLDACASLQTKRREESRRGTQECVRHGGMGIVAPWLKARAAASQSVATQLAEFIGKFDPRMAKLIRSCRAAVRKRLPTANELVYDNYNFFVIGYSFDRARVGLHRIAFAANAKGMTLFFYYGARLPDPAKILEGSGNQVRFIRMESAATLARPEVEALVAAAIAHGKNPPIA